MTFWHLPGGVILGYPRELPTFLWVAGVWGAILCGFILWAWSLVRK